MPRPHTTMRQIRNVLRLHFAEKLSVRDTALSLAMARSTVADYLIRSRVAGLSWPLPEEMDDDQLERRLFPEMAKVRSTYPQPDFEVMKKELAKKGVTLQLLWFEYREMHPDGYGYSQFCQRYRDWRRRRDVVMRQDHKAGEKMFVDFPGLTIPIYDPQDLGDLPSRPSSSSRSWAPLPISSPRRCAPRSSMHWVSAHVARLRVLRRRARDRGPRQLAQRRHEGTSLRARPQRHLPRAGHPLRNRPHPRAPLQAPRQGQGRSGRAAGRALDHRGVTTPSLHVLGGAQRGDRRARRAPERQTLQEARGFSRLALSRSSTNRRFDHCPRRVTSSPPGDAAKVNIDYHVEVDHHYYSVPYQLAGSGRRGAPHQHRG